MKEVILAALNKAAYRTQILGDNRMHNIIIGEDLEALAETIVEILRHIDIDGTKYRLFKLHTPRSGTLLIGEERQRQLDEEGWTPEHDAKHVNNELALAASCYCLPCGQRDFRVREQWPFDYDWWKPTPEDRIHELVKAGALIAAEIERIQRL